MISVILFTEYGLDDCNGYAPALRMAASSSAWVWAVSWSRVENSSTINSVMAKE